MSTIGTTIPAIAEYFSSVPGYSVELAISTLTKFGPSIAAGIGAHALINGALDSVMAPIARVKESPKVFVYSAIGTIVQDITFCSSFFVTACSTTAVAFPLIFTVIGGDAGGIMAGFCSPFIGLFLGAVVALPVSLAAGIKAEQFVSQKIGKEPISRNDIMKLMLIKTVFTVACLALVGSILNR